MLVTMTSNSDPGCIDLSPTAASKVGQNADHPADLHVPNTDFGCETRESDNEHFDGTPPVIVESFSAHERDDSAEINPPALMEGHGADEKHIDHGPEAIACLANKKCDETPEEDPASIDDKEFDVFEDAEENAVDIEDESFNAVEGLSAEGNVTPILKHDAEEDAKSTSHFDHPSAAGGIVSTWESKVGRDKEFSSALDNVEPKESEMPPLGSDAQLEKLLSAVGVSDTCSPVNDIKNEGNIAASFAVDQRPSSGSISSLDVTYEATPRPQTMPTVNRTHTAPTEISSIKSPKDAMSHLSTETDQMSVATKYFNQLAEEEKARKAAEFAEWKAQQPVPYATKYFNAIEDEKKAKIAALEAQRVDEIPLATIHFQKIEDAKKARMAELEAQRVDEVPAATLHFQKIEMEKKRRQAELEAARPAVEIPVATQYFNKLADEEKQRKAALEAARPSDEIPIATKYFNEIAEAEKHSKAELEAARTDDEVPIATRYFNAIAEEEKRMKAERDAVQAAAPMPVAMQHFSK
mmetsp:Transcript_29375/g.59253  ORF Transcript_29375/g.59253 Transcript_29375/m.59253 type:complete len:524 (+) Transcript_29375:100-1671(+)